MVKPIDFGRPLTSPGFQSLLAELYELLRSLETKPEENHEVLEGR